MDGKVIFFPTILHAAIRAGTLEIEENGIADTKTGIAYLGRVLTTAHAHKTGSVAHWTYPAFIYREISRFQTTTFHGLLLRTGDFLRKQLFLYLFHIISHIFGAKVGKTFVFYKAVLFCKDFP
jgi:hypothetical protein